MVTFVILDFTFWLQFAEALLKFCQSFSQIVWGWAVVVFERLQRFTTYDRVKIFDFVVFSQLVFNFLRLVWRRTSNNSSFSGFPSKMGIVVLSEFRSSEIRRMVLKLAKLLLLANCWRAKKYWSASTVASRFPLRIFWLSYRTRFLLVAWGRFRRSVRNFFVNSCHHVGSLLGAEILKGLNQKDTYFRMRIVLGTILCFFWFPPFLIQDVSRMDTDWNWAYGFTKKSSGRERATKLRLLLLMNTWDTFFVTSPTMPSDNWVL